MRQRSGSLGLHSIRFHPISLPTAPPPRRPTTPTSYPYDLAILSPHRSTGPPPHHPTAPPLHHLTALTNLPTPTPHQVTFCSIKYGGTFLHVSPMAFPSLHHDPLHFAAPEAPAPTLAAAGAAFGTAAPPKGAASAPPPPLGGGKHQKKRHGKTHKSHTVTGPIPHCLKNRGLVFETNASSKVTPVVIKLFASCPPAREQEQFDPMQFRNKFRFWCPQATCYLHASCDPEKGEKVTPPAHPEHHEVVAILNKAVGPGAAAAHAAQHHQVTKWRWF